MARNGDFMKEIKLTKGYVALVDDADYKLATQFKWVANVRKNRDGSVKNVYALSNGTYLHRLLLGIADPEVEVDHKDHNGLNCQRYNLRVAENKNQQNARMRKDNASGFKGVHLRKDRGNYVSYIKFEGKRIHLGTFSDPLEAACAYDMAAVRLFGEFAHCNFAEAS